MGILGILECEEIVKFWFSELLVCFESLSNFWIKLHDDDDDGVAFVGFCCWMMKCHTHWQPVGSLRGN